MTDFELIVGIEIHVQLATASKMFCACSSDYDGSEPNTHVCPVCLGLPGTLPVPNARAVDFAARTGLALGCTIHERTYFERKNYHYPDLPKGYQISQYQRPLCTDGQLTIEVGAGHDGRGATAVKAIGIERVHMEEDTAKLTHLAEGSLVNFNRAGVPLVEIVSRPDLRSAEEAKAYVDAMRRILRWIGVSTGNLESGAMRADVNVSVRRKGDAELGVKVEVKNLNSLAAIKSAVEYEAERQVGCLQSGEPIVQETRGWQEGEGRTVAQRSKEQAHDYRYFPEPDLPPLMLEAGWIEAERADLPELPDARRARFAQALQLAAEEARVLTRDRATADYFEAVLAAYPGAPAAIAPWLTGPLFGLLNAAGKSGEDAGARVPPGHLAEVVAMAESGALSGSAAREVLAKMFASGDSAAAIVEREGLGQISDNVALEAAVRDAIAANPKAVQDYCGGKTTAIGFLVGGVMKVTRGQANPELARQLMEKALLAACSEQ